MKYPPNICNNRASAHHLFLNLIMKTVHVIQALCLLFIASPAGAASNYIGINTNEAVHFDASVPFADLFRTAEPFRENKEFTKGNISYDANGWVRNLNGGQAGTWIVRWLPAGTLPTGNYTVSYEGSGSLSYKESATLVSQAPGRDTITFKPDSNGEISAGLVIEKSDPANPIRNIRVTLPGGICDNNPYQRVNAAGQCGGGKYLPFAEASAKVVFNPDYLNFMRQFRTVRFMNMSGITRNELQSWDKRPHLEEATWGGKEGERGVPLEIMVQLANTLNANPWFNLPHRADDNFVRQYAEYVKANLRPNLRAYVEYTNEAWNSVFSQAQYVQQMGARERLDSVPLNAGLKYYAKRSKEIFQIWEQVFGGKQQLVRVLSGWAGNPATTPLILKAFDVSKSTDVFALAPYFYADQDALMQANSVDDIFGLLNGNQRYSISQTLRLLDQHALFLEPYGVGLVAYEGGQHLVHYGTKSKKEHPNPLLIEANRDPRMEGAYIELLDGFRKAGGKLFMAFSSPRASAFYGSWGIKEHINQPPAEAPKYRALTRF